jgi:hypothetical protein
VDDLMLTPGLAVFMGVDMFGRLNKRIDQGRMGGGKKTQ